MNVPRVLYGLHHEVEVYTWTAVFCATGPLMATRSSSREGLEIIRWSDMVRYEEMDAMYA